MIVCKPNIDNDSAELSAIDAGADDINDSGDQLVVLTSPAKLEAVRDAIGEDNVESAEVNQTPSQSVVVDDESKAKTLLNLIDSLEDLDDVVEVTSNFDIPEAILNKLQ